MHKGSWKARAGATNWMSRMTMHAFAKIGGVDMREFSSTDVLAVLKPIWTTLHGIAKKLRADIGAVVSLAVANRRCGVEALNAVAIAAKALPRQPKSEGHEAMELEAVPGFLRDLHDIQADVLLKLAMAFVVLTAKRSGEVRLAEKTEIRERDAMWVIPASRMKAGRAHREPLRQAQELSGDSAVHFPEPQHRQALFGYGLAVAPAAQRAHRHGPRLPRDLSHVGRRGDQPPARHLRAGVGPWQPRQDRGRLSAERPGGQAPDDDDRLGHGRYWYVYAAAVRSPVARSS